MIFGNQRILASAGVQQEDSLGLLLFSLVLLDSFALQDSTAVFVFHHGI